MEFLIIVDSVLRDESGHCNWGNAKTVEGVDIATIHSTYTCIIELARTMGIPLSIIHT